MPGIDMINSTAVPRGLRLSSTCHLRIDPRHSGIKRVDLIEMKAQQGSDGGHKEPYAVSSATASRVAGTFVILTVAAIFVVFGDLDPYL
jgi:hypothetical protein